MEDGGGAGRRMATGGRDDELERPERLINRYVQVLTVAQMAVRGLGALVLLWSTVVLLGGFVTLLKLKDFWFITMISFSQATRVFSATADEQYLYFLRHWCVPALRRPITTLLTTSHSQQQPANGASSSTSSSPYQGLKFMAYLVMLIPLVSIVLLHPVFVVFNIVVSLQLLMQHDDYVKGNNSSSDSSSADNLKPALAIFYSLALAQGTVYVLSLQVLEIAKDIPVRQVAEKCEFPWSWGPRYVKLYLDDTKFKCLKDISSASASRGRNLITYSSGLLDSDYEEEYLAGARMLVSFMERRELPAVNELIRSSRNRIQKLLMMLTWAGEGDREIRLLAAKIVAHVAGDISVAQFPGILECVSSLLKPAQDNPFKAGSGGGSKPNGSHVLQLGPVDCQLIQQGLKILEKLTGDKSNCLEICKAETVLGDIWMAYNFSRSLSLIIQANEQVDMLRPSFTVLANLAGLRAPTADAVRQKIMKDFDHSWISDYASNPEIQKLAIKIFSRAFTQDTFEDNRFYFVDETLDLFLSCIEETEQEAPLNPVASPHVQAEEVDENKNVQVVAGEAVAAQLEDGQEIYREIFDRKHSSVLYELLEIIRRPKRTVYKAIAADILKHFYAYLKQGPRIIYPYDLNRNTHFQEILGEVIRFVGLLSKFSSFSVSIHKEEHTGHGDDEPSNNKLQAALLGIAFEIHDNAVVHAKDLARVIASVSYPSESDGLVGLLKEFIVRSSRVATPDHLEILNNAAELVSSVIERNSVPIQQILDQGIVDSLSEASKIMSDVESWTMFQRAHERGANWRTTFAGRVKNVQDLVNAARQPSV